MLNYLDASFIKKSFAINFDIKDNEIIDIGWCNVFLEEKEIIEMQN